MGLGMGHKKFPFCAYIKVGIYPCNGNRTFLGLNWSSMLLQPQVSCTYVYVCVREVKLSATFLATDVSMNGSEYPSCSAVVSSSSAMYSSILALITSLNFPVHPLPFCLTIMLLSLYFNKNFEIPHRLALMPSLRRSLDMAEP